ncbi:nitrogen fixation protein NifW [Acidihalobacter aeolianus]|uniref:Nitrogenase-stabilizing/protective protein NifW n=2 Tax=Acidihalobacter TaxID=1765964 RepID=A0A1D8K9Y1_9GAMM|nr:MULTISPECIES: nitrogenase-stabilizing/protective protein NifW [Acidihalobacter]AOV17788.1 nitrogen fixation protein NifW [Acidihalobacter aeolianus]OBS10601.1 nitrogen fixation protein NifW [Acidihalobacter prosperus]
MHDDDFSFEDDLESLSSAEDFLDYFEVEYTPSVVHVNRLHILQRFHDYLARAADQLPEAEEPRRMAYKTLLERAYLDFVKSDALTEKVFKVFKQQNGGGFVPLSQLAK